MTENEDRTVDVHGVEGHGRKGLGCADAERDGTHDVEGHWRVLRRADAEQDEADDTEGHGRYFSDENLKQAIKPVQDGLSFLRTLTRVWSR